MNSHRHTHPRESSHHQLKKAELQRTLPPHSAICAAVLPGKCSFSFLIHAFCSIGMEWAWKLQLPECSVAASSRGGDDRGREGLEGLGVLEWRFLGRWQVADCWRRCWRERRVGSAFPVGVPATMSAARESHPHGVKRSASPDDDVNNNGGVDEGWGLLKAGVGREGWFKKEEGFEVARRGRVEGEEPEE